MNEEKDRSRRRRGILLWSLIVLLLTTNGITLWLLLQEQEKGVKERVITKEVMVERDNIQQDLELLQKDYAELKTNDAVMQKDINEKKLRIEELIKEAAKHKNDKYIISKLRKETETLREIMKGYVRTIDSLHT